MLTKRIRLPLKLIHLRHGFRKTDFNTKKDQRDDY